MHPVSKYGTPTTYHSDVTAQFKSVSVLSFISFLSYLVRFFFCDFPSTVISACHSTPPDKTQCHLVVDCYTTCTKPITGIEEGWCFMWGNNQWRETFNSYSASHDNWCTGTLWNRIMTAQCEGMGEVGSARYEPALLPPCPSIRALCYSNCQRSIQSHQQSKS